MVFLLADIGGSNTRLAFADVCGLLSKSIDYFENAQFESFSDVLAAYRARHPNTEISRACIAIAGPVLGTSARLTNRDWPIDPTQISRITGAHDVVLLNDLKALALALPHVTTKQVSGPPPHQSGQCLVVGIGTGFNASPAIRLEKDRVVAMSAEIGHASMPLAVLKTLESHVANARDLFPTIEHVFSGAGLATLHQALFNEQARPEQILGPSQTDACRTTSQVFAEALAVLTQDLVRMYQPRAGVFFAGSVATNLLGSSAKETFVGQFTLSAPIGPSPNSIPIAVIPGGHAALWGCLALLKGIVEQT